MQRFVPSVLGVLMASAAVTQPAAAADMPRLYAAPAPLPGLYNWTGFYLGGQGGFGWGTFDINPRGSDIDGWFFGGQAGFNWQSVGSPWVVGVEIDSAGGQIERDIEHIYNNAFANAYGKVNYLGTARLRGGYAVDRGMVYVTGGVAWAHSEIGFSGADNQTIARASSSNSHVGFAAGAGFEWALSRSWTMKIEYLYNDLGSQNYLAGTLPGGTNADLRFSTLKLGVNYIFDWGRLYSGPKY